MISSYLSWKCGLFWLRVGWDPLCRADVCSVGTRERIPSVGLR